MKDPNTGWYLMICGTDRSKESCITTSEALAAFQRELEDKNFDYECIDALAGDQEGYIVVFLYVSLTSFVVPRELPKPTINSANFHVFEAVGFDCFSPNDFTVQVHRPKHPGGRSLVNITHKETGLSAASAALRSEHFNNAFASGLLRARVSHGMRSDGQFVLYPGEALKKTTKQASTKKCPHCGHLI